MIFTTDLVSRFSKNLLTSSNTYLKLDETISSFVYADSIERIEERSFIFDSIDRERRPVLIFNTDSTEFIVNLMACWISRRPVVPVCLPTRKRFDFINFIIEQTGSIIYTIDENHSQVFKLRSNTSCLLSNLAEVTQDSFSSASSSYLLSKPNYPPTTAVIQFSSGSTGTPKGVLITASNILSSLELMSAIWNISPESRFYSWLPLYHDLGLIFGILLPLMNGCCSYIISSADFAKKPSVWLCHLSSFSISHTAGSTSGYAMASTQNYPDNVSLETCEYCMIAAEHISAKVISRFLDLAYQFGLPSTSLSAAYGLAESTLAVTGDRIHDSLFMGSFDQSSLSAGFAKPSPTGRTLVSSGYALPGMTISIRDKYSVLPPGFIGEVFIEGPTVMHGYLGDSDISPLSKLPSGDLGFLYNDHLFITGRKKELIIVNGKNIYPEDLESAVRSSLDLFEHSTSVCFSIENDDSLDTIVFILELERHAIVSNISSVFEQINQIVTDLSGRGCFDIVLVQRAQLPKTTSGKLQRLKARELYLSKKLKIVDSLKLNLENLISSSSDPFTSEKLIAWLMDYEFKNAEPTIRSVRGQMFLMLDSLGSSELKNHIFSTTGVVLEDTFIWEFDTVDKLLHHVLSEVK